jgi:hypothetical protein
MTKMTKLQYLTEARQAVGRAIDSNLFSPFQADLLKYVFKKLSEIIGYVEGEDEN